MAHSYDHLLYSQLQLSIGLASKWDGIDPWISSRLAKTCELVARVAAQLTHIDLTMEVLQRYVVDKNITDPSTSVSFERYCDLRDYIRGRYSNEKNVVTIKGKFFATAHMDGRVAKREPDNINSSLVQ